MRHFLKSSSHQLKHFGHFKQSAPVCLCRPLHFGGVLNALSNGKLNEFLVYALLLNVVHVFKSPDLFSALIFEGKIFQEKKSQKKISLCVEFKSIPSALCPLPSQNSLSLSRMSNYSYPTSQHKEDINYFLERVSPVALTLHRPTLGEQLVVFFCFAGCRAIWVIFGT